MKMLDLREISVDLAIEKSRRARKLGHPDLAAVICCLPMLNGPVSEADEARLLAEESRARADMGDHANAQALASLSRNLAADAIGRLEAASATHYCALKARCTGQVWTPRRHLGCRTSPGARRPRHSGASRGRCRSNRNAAPVACSGLLVTRRW